MLTPMEILLTILILGQISAAVPILLTQVKQNAMNVPLAVFLLATGVLALNPIVESIFPNWYALYTALAFPAIFMLCPSLWFYVEGITSNTRWRMQKKQIWHFTLVLPAIVVSAMILALPAETHTAIFIEDADVSGRFVTTLLFCMLLMLLFWLAQCAYTLINIVRRLNNYRNTLKDLFSNNENKDLNWMNWLLFIAVCTWITSLITVFSSNLLNHPLFNDTTEAILSLLLIWSLIHFGLQQQPALLNDQKNLSHIKDTINLSNIASALQFHDRDSVTPLKKYQRSALSKEQSTRIAEKINAVMQNEHLYLDSNLSLQKLAKHLGISPNYISQTLNETLAVNFFDFVNQWRIEAAKPKILANQQTVLDIALEVGFNARSSFYKAFKQATGYTPSGFRKAKLR